MKTARLLFLFVLLCAAGTLMFDDDPARGLSSLFVMKAYAALLLYGVGRLAGHWRRHKLL